MDPLEFLDDFRAEANEHLRALDALLLQLERDPWDPQRIREMFLSAHTIKGGAAMLGLTATRDLAHAMEDVLAYLRDQREPLDGPTADLLFRALDMLGTLIDTAEPGQEPPDNGRSDLLAALGARATSGASELSPEKVAAAKEEALGPRVLLVEDSPTVRLMESMLLQDAGFAVDALADGREALERVQGTTYALVVSGVETRGLRGPDLALALRTLPSTRDVPIILMSSDDNASHRQQAAQAGVQAYIRKGSFGQQRLVVAARELVQAPGQ